MKRYRIFSLLCSLLLFYIQVSTAKGAPPVTDGGGGGFWHIYGKPGPYGYGGAAASASAASGGGGGAAAAGAAAASGGGGGAAAAGAAAASGGGGVATASAAAAARGGGGGGDKFDFKGKAVKAITELNGYKGKVKKTMSDFKTKAIAEIALMKADGPGGFKKKIKKYGGKILNHLEKEGIFNKKLAIEYFKNIDMKHIHKVIEESGIIEHFKDFDVKGWIKKSGIGDKMKEFFGDDCDIHAVAERNWNKVSVEAKSFVKKMPVYFKDLKEKSKVKKVGGKVKDVVGGKAGKVKRAVDDVVDGGGHDGASPATDIPAHATRSRESVFSYLLESIDFKSAVRRLYLLNDS